MFVANGWTIAFHRVFADRYAEMVERARRLRKRLPPEQYVRHPDVKLLAKLNRVIIEVIPADPETRDFWLEDDLSKFRRTKGHGLPERYRLFWAFSTLAKAIVILYLNDEQSLRKRGSARDPYALSKKMVEQGPTGCGLRGQLEDDPGGCQEDAGRHCLRSIVICPPTCKDNAAALAYADGSAGRCYQLHYH